MPRHAGCTSRGATRSRTNASRGGDHGAAGANAQRHQAATTPCGPDAARFVAPRPPHAIRQDPRKAATAPARTSDCAPRVRARLGHPRARRIRRPRTSVDAAPSPSISRSTGSTSRVGQAASRAQLLQIRQRVKEVGFHRADRAAEDARDLLVRQLVIRAGSASRAASAAAARSPPHAPARSPQQRTSRPLVSASTLLDRSSGSIRGRLRRDPVQAHVDRDADTARSTAPTALEPRGAPLIRANEHVLRQIARVLVVADEAIAELVDLTPVPFDDDVERLAARPARTRLERGAIRRRPGQRRVTSTHSCPTGSPGHGSASDRQD